MIDLESIGVAASAVEELPDGGFRRLGTAAARQVRAGVGDDPVRGKAPEQCQEPTRAARVARCGEGAERGDLAREGGGAGHRAADRQLSVALQAPKGAGRAYDAGARRFAAPNAFAPWPIDLDRFKVTNDTFGHPAGGAGRGAAGRRLSPAPGEAARDLRDGPLAAMARPFVRAGARRPVSASGGPARSGGLVDLGDMTARADEPLHVAMRPRPRRPSRAA